MGTLCLIVYSSLFLSACANTEKPHYILTDSELHQYQGGDTLNYGVISLSSDVTGTLTHTYEAVDLITPANKTLSAISRNTITEGGIKFSFPTPYFTQTETGNLMLEAYSQGSTTFWLSNDGNTAENGEFYPSPLSNLTEQTVLNMPLFTYENNIRGDGGDTGLQITPLGIETIETNYANFEAYKINIVWTATVQDTEQKAYRIYGTQWIYPPLGVVMFDYTIESPQTTSGIFGTLSSTNIRIPAEHKKEN